VRGGIWPLSVKSKVTLVATLLFLLSVLLVSAVQLYYVKVEMKAVLGEQQHAFVARVADELDKKLRVHSDLIAANATALSRGTIEDFDELQKWLDERNGLRAVFSNVIVVSANGTVLADTPKEGRRGLDISDREYFRTTVVSRAAYISAPFIGKTAQQPVVTFSAPVLDKEGGIVALVTGSLNLLHRNFLGDLAESKIGKTGSFALFTRDRTIVLSRDKSRILTPGPSKGTSPYFDRATAGLDGWEEAVNSRGLKAIYSYSPLHVVPWVLVASLPVEEAYAPIAATQRTIIEVTLLLSLLAAPIIWLAVRRLYDPLRRALGESERRFQQLADAITEVFWLTDPVKKEMLYVSAAYEQIWGQSLQSLYDSPRAWIDAIHPEDRQRVLEAADGQAHGDYDEEYRIVRGDGSIRWIHDRAFPVKDESGAVFRIAGVADDITARREAEIRIRRLNRVYAVLSGINSLIVRVRDRNELFREACRIAVEDGEFGIAWVGEVDPATLDVTPVAWNGLDDGVAPAKASARDDSPVGQGMVGRAVRDKKPVVTNDMEANPAAGGSRRAEALRKGMNSIIAMPLIVGEDVKATLTLFAKERNFFSEEELLLLAELAGDISFALDHIEKADRLNYLAYYDELTGLANRTLFLERLEERLLAARTHQSRLSVTVLDVERLRSINDAFGRHVGDALLKQAADRLVRLRGDATRLARIGSGNFAVVSADIESEAEVGRMTEEKLRTCFEPPFRIAERELTVPAIAGIAMYPSDGDDAETLLRCAASALKLAKARGERYLFFEAKMTERIAERLSLENKLRQAIEKQEFVLHYQPKIDLESRQIVGVEALIRWQSPEGLVPPVKFIPLLEETGLILQVGAWALERAALDHRRWVEQRLSAPRVAVNVSAIQLRQRDFASVVEKAIGAGLARTGVDIEVTESFVMEDLAESVAKLKAVRALGMGVALDDFGTGYSSLAYLARLPIETLKIDRSFISTMLKDPDTMTLVEMIINMAHSLRIKVVAEGVETEEQAAVLRRLRCDQMQGYLFSKPLPEAALVELLVKK
jgi:diguanylate cyclase (GGDEF)-like protein/PAS domain S-box-containing protein